MKFIEGVEKYAKENNLEFIKLGSSLAPQYRVRKGKLFIDFWNNGSFRDVEGKYFRRGASERGYGADHVNYYEWGEDDGCGFLATIKENIEKLAQSSKREE